MSNQRQRVNRVGALLPAIGLLTTSAVLAAASWCLLQDTESAPRDWPAHVALSQADASMQWLESMRSAVTLDSEGHGINHPQTIEPLYQRVPIVPETRVGSEGIADGISIETLVDPSAVRFDANEAGSVMQIEEPTPQLTVANEEPSADTPGQAEGEPESDAAERVWRSGGGLLQVTEVDEAEIGLVDTAQASSEQAPRRTIPRRERIVETVSPAETPDSVQTTPPPAFGTISNPTALPAPITPPAPATLPPTMTEPPPSLTEDADEADMPEELEETRVSSSPPLNFRPFTFWNGLLFRNMPDSVAQNPDFPSLHIVYPAHIWKNKEADWDYAPEERIREIARSIPAGTLVCFDIEHWRLKLEEPENFAREMDQLLSILRWTREENPDLTLGFYSIVPQVTWHKAGLPHDHPDWVAMRAYNDALQPIVDEVDVLFPWLYTFIDDVDRDRWAVWARASVAEARRLAGDKPIYPFLWFRYHQVNVSRKFQMVEPEYWQLQLDTLRSVADGAVIWGGYQQNFRESSEWWQLTESLLGEPVPIPWGD